MPTDKMVKQEESRGVIHSLIRYDEPDGNTNLPKELRASLARNKERELLVDTASGRRWTGAQLLEATERIATNLIKNLKVKPNDTVLIICDHTDHEIIFALGAIFAGAAIFGATPADGFEEFKTLCELNRPNVIITQSRMHLVADKLRRSIEGLASAPVIWIDNPTQKSDHQTAPVECEEINGNQKANGKSIEASGNNNHVTEDSYARLVNDKQVVLFDQLMNEGQIDRKLIDDVLETQIDLENHALVYLLTSGSTGRPKIVPSLQGHMVHQIFELLSATKNPVGSASEPNKTTGEPILPFKRDSVIAGDLPLDHGAGLNCMFLSLVLGSKLIIMPSYDEPSYWQGVHDYRISHSIASTTFTYKLLRYLKEMIKSGESRKWDLSCLEYLSCAGAKLAIVDLVREIQSSYPNMMVTQAYGCTEVGYISTLLRSESLTHIGSVGYLYPGLKAKVVDFVTREPVPFNTRGELCLWSRTKFVTYKCYPGEDVAAIMRNCHDSDGFYRTGDSVQMDPEGRLYIHGRIKETLCLMEDWKILPAELEEVVDKHPLVEQTAIIGVPSVACPGTDAPRAFIRLISTKSKQFAELRGSRDSVDGVECAKLAEKLEQRDTKFLRDHIYQFAANRTAQPKHLKGGVYFLDDFPRNGILQKIDRKVLRQMDVDQLAGN